MAGCFSRVCLCVILSFLYKPNELEEKSRRKYGVENRAMGVFQVLAGAVRGKFYLEISFIYTVVKGEEGERGLPA